MPIEERPKITLGSQFGSLRRSGRLITAVSALLIGGQVLFVGWAVSTTWFKQDDFALLLRASSAGGFPSSAFDIYIGHFIPGVISLFAIAHKAFGMNWSVIVVTVMALQLVASLLSWQVFQSFFGRGRIAVVLLAVYVASTMTFTTTMWWASAAMYLPLQIGFPASLLLLQRALRHRSAVNALLPTLAVAGATLFFEKSVVITPFLILLVAATPITADAPTRAKERLVSARMPLGILTAATFCYGILYLIISRSSNESPQFEIGRLSEFTLRPITETLIPSLIGGPQTYLVGDLNSIQIFSSPALFETVLSFALIAGLFIYSVTRVVRWARYWFILAAFAIINVLLLVTAGRGWVIMNPRNMSELVFPMILLLALALGLSRFESEPRLKPTKAQTVVKPLVISVLLSAFAIFVLVNATFNARTVRYFLSGAPAYGYTENALRSSTSFSAPVDLVRQYVSGDLINGFLGDGKRVNFTSTILRPSNGPWNFVDSSTNPYMVLDDGTVVPARSSRETVPQFEIGLCYIDLHDGVPTDLLLNGDPFPWTWYGTITTSAKTEAVITVDWNQGPVQFVIPPNSATTVFYLPGGGNNITITANGGDVCVSDLGFGNLVPDDTR